MDCIILAAGYATRLYPLTKNKPKSLLEVAGKTILQYILEKVERVAVIKTVYLVSNARFYQQFLNWVNAYHTKLRIDVINDGSDTNEKRLGAIGDINLAIQEKQISNSILVLAGDNLFDFELTDFINYHNKIDECCITVHDLYDNIEQLKRTGVVQVDEKGKVIDFEEKPKYPKSSLAVPPFYIYTKETLGLFGDYLNEGNNPDAPGNFIPWLIKHKDVYAYKFQGNRYDIGTIESYKAIIKLLLNNI